MRKTGIILIVCGLLMGLGYLLYWFQGVGAGGDTRLDIIYLLRMAFHVMPMALKIITVGMIVIGLALLVVLLIIRAYNTRKGCRRLGAILVIGGLLIGLGYILYWFKGFSDTSGLSIAVLLRLAFVTSMPLWLKAITIVVLGVGFVLSVVSLAKPLFIASRRRKPKLSEP
jgi:hypothetical protein